MFINITDSETGNNKGSCGALVNYLEKENRLAENKHEPELWFNGNNSEIRPQEFRVKIDYNISKLGRNDAKFFLINVSPSQKEIQFLKEQFGALNTGELMKEFAIRIMDQYAKNFKRDGIHSNSDLLWYGKLEHYRYYSHTDSEVKQGLKQKGERKEGEQMHIQIIVSRKDITNKIKLSPMNNSQGRNAEHSAKLGQFDRKAFKQSGESLFDEMFGFDRNLKDTMAYAITMKNGNAEEKSKFMRKDLKFDFNSFSKMSKELKLEEIFLQLKTHSPAIIEFLNLNNIDYNNSQELLTSLKKRKKKKRSL